MDGRIAQVAPMEKSVEPGLRIAVELKYEGNHEAPLSVSGVIEYPADMFLATLFEWPDHNQSTFPLRGGTSGVADPLQRTASTAWLNLGARLGRREIDHIEEVRQGEPKGDVHLSMRVAVKTLVATASIWPMEDVEGKTSGGARPVVTSSNPRAAQLLHQDLNSGYLLQKTTMLNLNYRIPGGDWAHEFAPKLGIGRFTVLEIPETFATANLELEERLKAAFRSARTAQEYLRAGEWEDVCEALRGAWEVLRDYPLLQQILEEDGYSQNAAKMLNSAFNGFFGLASKFVHTLDTDKKTVLPELRPDLKTV